MRILAIRIQNLASLEGITEIDFTQEPLCSAGIFAITGPTGAGKSTILDALCLALYAKTPRYLQAKELGIEVQDVQGSSITQGDTRGILRDGTVEGFAEVDFIGVDGQPYRATWSVRRARNKVDGALQAYQITLKNCQNHTDIPGKKNELLQEIERLVGLNFEQFTRSILLAQGDFTAFLKAGKDEKSSLLEKLTGTHIYSEISKKIYDRYRNEEQLLRDLRVHRDGVATLTTEELDALKAECEKWGVVIQEKEKQVADLHQEADWHRQLNQFVQNLSQAHDEQQQARQAKAEAQQREQKLQQIEAIQPTRSWIDALQYAQKQLALRQANKKELKTSLLLAKQEQAHVQEQTENTRQQVQRIKQQQEESRPYLEEAKKLDVQLREKQIQVKTATEEMVQAEQGHQAELDERQIHEKEAAQLKEVIAQLNQWKEENSKRQPIAEHQQLIVSKLADAQQWVSDAVHIKDLIQTTQQEIQIAKQEENQYAAAYQIKATDLEKQQAIYQERQKELQTVPIDQWEAAKEDADKQSRMLVEAQAHWKVLFQNQQEATRVTAGLQEQEKELADSRQALVSLAQELAKSKIQLETAAQSLQKAQFAATEHVSHLRAQLVPNEPCAVCGSTEHPYAQQAPQTAHVLTELAADHLQYQEQYEQLRDRQSKLEEACLRLEKQIATLKETKQNKERQLDHLTRSWKAFPIYASIHTIADSEKGEWLTQQFARDNAEQQQLQEKIKKYQADKAALEQQKAVLEQLTQVANQLENQQKDAQRKSSSLAERLTQQQQEAEKTHQQMQQVALQLADYFQNENWFKNWQKNPVSFLAMVNDFAQQWQTKIIALENNLEQQRLVLANLEHHEKQLERLSQDKQHKATRLQKQQEDYEQLQSKRRTIFEGKTMQEVELEFKESLDVAEQHLDRQKTELEKRIQENMRLETALVHLNQEVNQLHEQEVLNQQRIDDWLAKYNESHQTALQLAHVVQLLQWETDWITEERQFLRQLDDTLTKAQSVLSERQTTLQAHQEKQVSQRSVEEVAAQLLEARGRLQEAIQARNEIDFRIRQDEANKKQIGDLMKKMEKQAAVVDNWAKLNEIIGSADGKKFRQIAQEYTLDVLLSYANVHLEMLSKRYLLQRIPNTLGLQVLDQDMGDEVRTVYSLSGGESFLVSLALALGLASLSSSRMKVESLFIDEGFGSLDPATLNVAMDALERLHNQGRKVGVISHVQEMTERIPVQIKVNKQRSGKSRIEVLGNSGY